MSSSEETINEGNECPDTERVSDVYPRAVRQQSPEEEAVSLVRRAIRTLEDVHRLLEALAPPEIEAAVVRLYMGRVRDDRRAICWKLYATRHRALADLFASQREAFVREATRTVTQQPEAAEFTGP
jgi:hypothetical protein